MILLGGLGQLAGGYKKNFWITANGEYVGYGFPRRGASTEHGSRGSFVSGGRPWLVSKEDRADEYAEENSYNQGFHGLLRFWRTWNRLNNLRKR